ncbi:MAG: nucleoside-diphosphate sugar epimerase/dehydratase [Sulfuricellaceae bacterium]|nr:nucleoside-diphosphate sugar epimerase/dehydratase [Sulfuricellaceae bacterium]
MLALDVVLLPLALWSAIALRLGEWLPNVAGLYWLMLLAPVVAIPIFIRIGLYRAVIRYMEDRFVLTVLKGVTLAVLLLLAFSVMTGVGNIPRSAVVIYWIIALLYIGGSRMIARAFFRRFEFMGDLAACDRVAIYGAGEAGIKLAASLHAGQHSNVVAFFDDNPDRHGSEIGGIKVFSPTKFAEVLAIEAFSSVLLAMPSASHKSRQEIIRRIEPHKVSVKTIPDTLDLLTGAAKIDEIREVAIEDLLGRDSVCPIPHLIDRCISGKVVMVTGAGGSIGSELCRQIIMLEPKCLILFEMSEFALYQIEQEINGLKSRFNSTAEIVPMLGSVTHQKRVEMVLRVFGVQTIYHAAAYKHVPLVEHNLIEGVVNNVFGTLRVADAARNAQVETFVLISTDKAVRPTNVMGATKRLAELILQAFAGESGETRFSMVRFGNVLGSSGSVVPLFRKQIQNGGPVTVTHPEITRYFMTIPEAANLVLQAGAMGQGGDVFVLDMGKPLKIVDLARRMIHLSGLDIRDETNPGGNISIEYTGLRSGEKLYEELLIGENVSGTEHPLIMRAEESELSWNELSDVLDRIDAACHQFEYEKVRDILLEIVDGYQPQGEIHDYVWQHL